MTLHLAIDGMHCAGCVTRVTNTLSKLPGVQPLDVQLGSASLSYDESQIAPPAILEAISRLGFTARLA
jgi:copper chaperone CopZ